MDVRQRIAAALALLLLGGAWIWIGRLSGAPTATASGPTPTPDPVRVGIQAPRPGKEAPDFTLETLDGETIRLSDLRGKIVLINFWATWCPPCREEMPALQAAYEKHRDEGFLILGVDLQEAPDTVRAFRDEFGITFPLLLDRDGAVFNLYRIQAIPTSFFVDPQGTIQVLHVGPMTLTTIERYLEGIR